MDVLAARQLARVVRDRKIEILHAHMARDYPAAAFAAKRNHDARLVITRHVLFSMNRLHSLALANVSRVIAVSGAVACSLNERRIFPSAKIVVVQNGIDVERFVRTSDGFDRQEFCCRLRLPADKLLVGTVGEITKLKGHEDFVQAASQIVGQVPEAGFIIAGEDHSRTGEHEAALNQAVDKLGLRERVYRLGRIDKLAELYRAFDVFVSASHSESFGLAIVEAMASGTAVVATATEGASEILEDGVSGRLVPVGASEAIANAVVHLLSNSDERKSMGNAAQRRARENFGLERMIAETEQVYREALG